MKSHHFSEEVWILKHGIEVIRSCRVVDDKLEFHRYVVVLNGKTLLDSDSDGKPQDLWGFSVLSARYLTRDVWLHYHDGSKLKVTYDYVSGDLVKISGDLFYTALGGPKISVEYTEGDIFKIKDDPNMVAAVLLANIRTKMANKLDDMSKKLLEQGVLV